MLGGIVAHQVAQCIGIPPVNRLLPPRPRIARCLRAHPSGFTTLVAKHPVHEQARVQSCALLREQWTYLAAGQQPVAADAKQHALTLVKRVAGQGKPDSKLPFAIESTIRQLDRYCSWWTQANGFLSSEMRPRCGDQRPTSSAILHMAHDCAGQTALSRPTYSPSMAVRAMLCGKRPALPLASPPVRVCRQPALSSPLRADALAASAELVGGSGTSALFSDR
jgi:hypothetical protein